MKKFLLVTVTLLVILFLGITFSLDRIVKTGIESLGSEMTGTPVRVESVSISPISGQGTISGFTVANPDDFEGETMISISEFSISLDVTSLLSDEILIHEIILTDPAFYVEQTVAGNNVLQILDHINATAESETSETSMIIERFYMENAGIYVGATFGEDVEASYVIESLELKNIGSETENRDTIQTIAKLADSIADEVLSEAVKNGFERVRDAIRGIFGN
ncbi:MAG TPA: hypothetical protein VKM36_12475 [Balneolaceae bacterium]|nr:hypothetical protein [Balneolaceae bacterium]